MSLMKSTVCGAAGGNCTATVTAPSAACLDERHPNTNRRIAPSRARKLRTGRWATGPGLITLKTPHELYQDAPGYKDGLHLISFTPGPHTSRSEEHTSELQSLRHLVCRLLLEKKQVP